ncbi:endonuclease NucS domain-containing protein [Salipaludibacillus agaradhaerens]|uniref:endonuclease NucS domain-containing protein n=1 Tax=Salipaludibacillus agaradhaerens TaxID=76935 RepID=UPI00356950A3
MIKLFRLNGDSVDELEGQSVAVEKSLQHILERHLETFLGIRFLASEYRTGKRHAGRIDTLGIDENNSPVIIEYKRSINENVINQGLFYLDWLLDHKAKLQSVGVFVHPPLIVSLTYRTFRGSLSPPKLFDFLKF